MQNCLNHKMHIDWCRTNQHGNPALCCSECVTTGKKAKWRGQPRYIKYIKTREIQPLLDMGVEERFAPSVQGNFTAYMG